MLRTFMAVLCLLTAGAIASAQKPSADKAAKSNRTVTLVGCVEKGSAPNQFTLADEQAGKYLVAGNRIGRYVGQRVEIAGISDNSKFKVKGGLWPSPNAAGQAGAIDPVRAAMDAQPGGPSSATGEVDLPKVNVKSVRLLDARCG
jgi:hypothetical protein